MAAPGTIQIPLLLTTPSAPPVGFVLMYVIADTIYLEDSSGNVYPFAATTSITGLTGDVTATGPGNVAATVNSVGGQSASAIAAATVTVGNATSVNTPLTLVERDASGNFSAATITAALNGNASTATLSLNFSGSLSGDVTGTQGATVVSLVGGKTAADVASATGTVDAATSINTPGTLVERDGSGNFAAGTITANLTGNVTGNVSGSSGSFTGSLSGDVTGTQGATVVGHVGGKTASDIASATTTVDAATSINTPGTLVERDGFGNFSAGTITANLTGNASGSAASFTGSMSGDVTGTQGATVVATVGGRTASDIASATATVDAATFADTPSTLVERDGSGNFSAGVITANLTGNVTGNVSGSSGSFTGSLSGDVTGTQGATVVSMVGGATASDVASATATVDAATSSNTPSTLVERDGSGNFSASTITNSQNDVLIQNFTQTSQPATPPTTQVDVFVDLSNTFSRMRALDETGLIMTFFRDQFIPSYNNSGSTISTGQLVYITGSFSGVSSFLPTIGLAKANSTTTAPSVGFACENISNNSYGRIQIGGLLSGINLSAFSNGQTVYLSSSTAGGLTVTEPLSPNVSQVAAIVINNSVSGSLLIFVKAGLNTASGSYRSSFQIGPSTGSSAVDLVFSNDFNGTLEWNPSSTFKLTIPPVQGGSGTYLTNDGTGTLSWSNPLVNIDGGVASSVYTSGQFINGGTP